MKGLWKLLSSLKVGRETFFQHKVFKVLPFFLRSEVKFALRPCLLVAGLRRIHTPGIMQTEVEFLHHLFRGRIPNTPCCWPLPLAFLFSSPFCMKLNQRYVVGLSHTQTTEPETWAHIPALDRVVVSFEHKYITSQETSQVKIYSAVQQLLVKMFWKDFLSSVPNWGFQPFEEGSYRKPPGRSSWTTKLICFRVLLLNSNNTLQYYISISVLSETHLIWGKKNNKKKKVVTIPSLAAHKA